jgi:hypothetical protein
VRSPLVPFVVCCFLALVWLNQGESKAKNDLVRVAADTDPIGHAIPQVRHTLMDLYERAWDEEIYFAVASAVRGLPYDHQRLSDRGEGTPAYYAKTPPEDGHWHAPYTEVPFEYPALVLPALIAPSFASGADFAVYSRVFGAMMGLLLLGAAAVAIRAQPSGRTEAGRWWAMAAMLAAQGGLAIQRLDAVLALLLAWTLFSACERKPGATGAALGLSTATKLLPALLAPLLWAADRVAWPRGKLLRGAGAFALAAGLGFAPMLLVPRAVLDVLHYHGQRGLQVESTYAVLLGAWEIARGTVTPATLSFGSLNLSGSAAWFLARASTPVTLAVLALLVLRFARAPEPPSDQARRDRIALALLAGVTTLWLTAKVFSPQYLTWAIPLVLGVSGARGVKLTWVLTVVMLVTQIYLRSYYDQVVRVTPLGVATLLGRLALLGVFAALLLARDQASRMSSVAAAKSAVASSK